MLKFSRSQIISINAMLCAIIMLFVLVPVSIGVLQLAFIPIIAVIISAEFLGWKNGALSGLFFGIVSLCNHFFHPTILSPAFYNPLVSIVPRILIGVVAYFTSKGVNKIFKKGNGIAGYTVGAAFGVITNTALVLGTIMAFNYNKTFTSGGNATLVIGWQWLSAIITGNFLIELLIVTLVTPPIVMALKKTILPKYVETQDACDNNENV